MSRRLQKEIILSKEGKARLTQILDNTESKMVEMMDEYSRAPTPEAVTEADRYAPKESPRELVVGIMCEEGRHRSVAVAEQLAKLVTKKPRWTVEVQHRDLVGLAESSEEDGDEEDGGTDGSVSPTLGRKSTKVAKQKDKEKKKMLGRKIGSLVDEELAPDEEDHEGHTGQARASATHVYCNSCIVIMPRQHQASFFLNHAKKGDVNMKAWISPVIETVKQWPEDDRQRTELTEICRLIVVECAARRQEERATHSVHAWAHSSSISDKALGLAARAALQLRQPGLFVTAAMEMKDGLPMAVYPAFGETLSEVDFVQWQSG
ncbi:MAG: hypothetical protein L6R35_002242, partial [Caloplaca aegaea]